MIVFARGCHGNEHQDVRRRWRGSAFFIVLALAACGSEEAPGGGRDAASARMDAAADGADAGAGLMDAFFPNDGGMIVDGPTPGGADAATVDARPAMLTWRQLPELGAAATEVATQVALASDGQGGIYLANIYATAQFGPPSSLRVFRLNAGTWELVGGQPVFTENGKLMSLAHVAASGAGLWANSSSGLFSFAGGSWQPIALPTLAAGELPGIHPPDLAVDGTGRLLALYAIGKPQDTQAARLYQRVGTGWQSVGGDIAIPQGGGIPNEHLAVSPAGKIYVLVRGMDNAPTAHALVNGQWQLLGKADNTVAPGASFFDIAVGPDERPVVSWRENPDQKQEIYVAKYEPGVGFVPLGGRLNLRGNNASYAQLAVDSSGTPIAVWRESGIFAARFTGGVWQPYLGDGQVSVENRGTLPALVLDSGGLPVVAWESFSDEKQAYTAAARAVFE